MGNDPQSEYWQSQRLDLLHLQKPVKLKESNIDVDITTLHSEDMEVLHSVEPGDPKALFLRFPFKAPAETINQVTEGLTIFDHPFFKFENEEDEMRPLIHLKYGKIKVLPFSSTLIFNQIYMDLKHDISAGSGKMWFNDELINFYSRWLLRTGDPPHITAT